MRAILTSLIVGLSGLLGACSSVDSSPSVAGVSPPVAALPPETAIPKSDVQRDLVLELRRASNEPLDHERDPRIEVWIVNKSATRSYPVILANDGSEVGWREPHAFFTIELLRASGKWEPPPAAPPGGRCGLYAVDWTKDMVTLAPGERAMMPWMPYHGGELGDASKVRVVARYEYGEHARDKSKVPPALHAMPEYALSSAPLEIPVAHPYALELRIKGALPTAASTPVAASVDVLVENRSKATMPVGTSENGAQLWFEAVFAPAGGAGAGGAGGAGGNEKSQSLFLDTEPTYASKDTLAAGARRSIVTPATKTDVVWSVPEGQRLVKMRAIWRIWDEDGGPYSNVRRVESPWVTAR